jgi:3-hydroxyacyl-[acyl-carrier-protein] dehydratase
MAQTKGQFVLSQMAGADKNRCISTIDGAKFRVGSARRHGQYHVRKIARKKNMWWFRGEAKVAGLMVAEAEVGAMVA